ncbi:MAG: D-alanine--D-alanine ligase [Caldiserica bacterium]|nr:MAG: D-alanine--D-alanine ligase [Caldisericota bacterium]
MNKKILVLYGGFSEEREVSIGSGKAIAKSLKKNGFIVKTFDFKGKLEKILENFAPDVVFVALHGKYGEDGTVQGALEIANIPYTGSNVLASAICMNKLITKQLLTAQKIETANYYPIKKKEKVLFKEIAHYLRSNKLVVKPVDQGSTIGISIVNDEKTFKKGLDKAFAFSDTVIIEEFLDGKEITVSIIGNGNNIKVLPIIEIAPENEFYDYESKYVPGMSRHIIPARIPKNIYDKAKRNAILIYEEFGLRDFARIDFIVANNIPFALEANTIPGFTETSLVPDAAKADGITFDNLTAYIVKEALKRGK